MKKPSLLLGDDSFRKKKGVGEPDLKVMYASRMIG